MESEPFAEVARAFVEQRLLQREVYLTLHGTDKTGSCIVATVHHPKGSIAVELLKRGYGKMSDWTARMMDSLDLPALRIAENSAKVSEINTLSYIFMEIFIFFSVLISLLLFLFFFQISREPMQEYGRVISLQN